jgi:membrane protein implicated in regulation of membrane protease activity
MESSNALPNPDDAAAVLDDAERSRSDLVGEMTLPPRYHAWIGSAVAVQSAATAVGLAVDEPWGIAVVLAGARAFGLVAGVQVRRFRQRNGVWVSGFVSRAVLGTAGLASLGYTAGVVSAVFAAFAGLWWLAGLCAVGGGVAYALAGRRWWRKYRQDPSGNANAESALMLAILLLLAGVGLGLLLALS